MIEPARTAPTWLLCLMGSGEFEPWASGLEHDLLAEATGDGSVAIVATASAPEGPAYHAWTEKGLAHYAELGAPAHVADLRGRDDAFRGDVVATIASASLVFMSGGNAAYLATTLADSPAWSAMRALLDRGGAIAGCSAGAMVLGQAAPPRMAADLQTEDVETGLELLSDAWIWPHWNGTSDEIRERLLDVTPHDVDLLLIDETTAAVARDGRWDTFGRGRARWIRRATGDGLLAS
jgi:cyanophycinase